MFDIAAGVKSTTAVGPHHGAYPRVLDVHSWVSHGDEVPKQAAVNDAYPEVLDVQTQVSRDIVMSGAPSDNVLSDRGYYPGVLNVHSQVSRDSSVGSIAVQAHHDGVQDQQLSKQHVGTEESHGTRVSELNPGARQFIMRNPELVHKGVLCPDLAQNWEQVQRVQAGHPGDPNTVDSEEWGVGRPTIRTLSYVNKAVDDLPFQAVDDLNDILGIAPKQIQKTNTLRDLVVRMP